jgi:hypothetical protein
VKYPPRLFSSSKDASNASPACGSEGVSVIDELVVSGGGAAALSIVAGDVDVAIGAVESTESTTGDESLSPESHADSVTTTERRLIVRHATNASLAWLSRRSGAGRQSHRYRYRSLC